MEQDDLLLYIQASSCTKTSGIIEQTRGSVSPQWSTIQFGKNGCRTVLDKSLSFREHILYTKAESNKKLNIIKILCNTNYGSDYISLLRILNTVILPT